MTDMETMGIILAAQNAGNGQAAIYGTLSPGIVAAGFVLILVVAFWILSGILDHFTDKG